MNTTRYINIIGSNPWLGPVIDYLNFEQLYPRIVSAEEWDANYKVLKNFRKRLKHIVFRHFTEFDLEARFESTCRNFGTTMCFYNTEHFIFYQLEGSNKIEVVPITQITCREGLSFLVDNKKNLRHATFVTVKSIFISRKDVDPQFKDLEASIEVFMIPDGLLH